HPLNRYCLFPSAPPSKRALFPAPSDPSRNVAKLETESPADRCRDYCASSTSSGYDGEICLVRCLHVFANGGSSINVILPPFVPVPDDLPSPVSAASSFSSPSSPTAVSSASSTSGPEPIFTALDDMHLWPTHLPVLVHPTTTIITSTSAASPTPTLTPRSTPGINSNPTPLERAATRACLARCKDEPQWTVKNEYGICMGQCMQTVVSHFGVNILPPTEG
ncbi:hypothetical protein LTS18_000645, partial [Coniosporium uncinatum]